MKYCYKTNVMSKLLYHVDTIEDFFRLVTILKIWLSYCLCLGVCQKSNKRKKTWGNHDQWHIRRKVSPDEIKDDIINDVLNKLVSKHSCTTSWQWQNTIFLHIPTQTSHTREGIVGSNIVHQAEMRNNWYGCRKVKRHGWPRWKGKALLEDQAIRGRR